jgi:hypothetical protein
MFGFGGVSGFSRDKTDAEREVGEDLQRALDSQDGRWDLTGQLHNRDHLQIALQILRANATHHTFTHLRRTSRCAAHVAQLITFFWSHSSVPSRKSDMCACPLLSSM